MAFDENLNADRTTEQEDYSAFSAGVEPGGLRNTAQIKILIGFLVGHLNGQIQHDKMIEILQLHGLANYFEASQALEDMIQSGSLNCDENQMLTITRKGSAAVDELENEIPRSVREKALNDALHICAVERRKNENKIFVEEISGGFNVTFTVCNGDDQLMKLTVFAADSAQVERIRKNFLRDPVGIYANIVSSLFT